MKIPYREYHNFYRQRILCGGAWSHQVLAFFNNALFPGTSSSAPSVPLNDDGPGITWEENFERAMEQGLEGSVFDDVNGPRLQMLQNNSPAATASLSVTQPAPFLVNAAPPIAVPPAISAPPAMSAPPIVSAPPAMSAAPAAISAPSSPILNPALPVPIPSESISSAMEFLNLKDQNVRVELEHVAAAAINTRPKPKPRVRKTKATNEGAGAEVSGSTVRRSGRNK